MNNPLIVWTRGALDWQRDKDLLSKEFTDSSVISLPCIHNEFVDAQLPTYLSLDCVLFASRHAVEACWQSQHIKEALKDCRYMYAVGPSTAAAMKERGWEVTGQGHAGGRELALMVAENHGGEDLKVLLPGGFERAGEIELTLKQHDFTVFAVNVYRTVLEVRDDHGFKRNDYEKLAHATVCFASPSSVRSYRTWCEGIFGRILGHWVCAIGETTAKECRRTFSHVQVAKEPTVEALVALAASRPSDPSVNLKKAK